MPYLATDDGVAIYYEQRGSGTPIVLVHGYAANRQFFTKQVDRLADDFRVITYDMRGHGDSANTEQGLRLPQYADDLHQLVTHLELDTFDVLAWAMGGKVLFEYVDQFGADSIGKLCLIETTPKTISDADWDGRTEAYDHEDALKTLQSMVYGWEGYVERFYMPYLFAPGFEDTHPEQYEWAGQQVKNNVPHVMINTWISSVLQDYRPVLGDVSVPCLLARGQQSRLYEDAIAEYLVEKLPQARTVTYDEAGHALQLEVPDAFTGELIEFLS